MKLNFWKVLLIILWLGGCYTMVAGQKPSNANYFELCFKVNTPKKFGHTADITGTVVKKHKTSNKGVTSYFVVLVNYNTTYKIELLEKPVFDLIQDGQRLTLRNCVILKLKQ